MLNQQQVTVICTCFNHEKYVVEALNSVTNQDYSNIQLIIVDDCSTDNSVKVIREWLVKNPTVTFIVNEHNLGITKSFNHAYKYATGGYLIDLAGDDILLPECVTLQLNIFNHSSHKNTGLVYGNAHVINENGEFLNYYFPVKEDGSLLKNSPTGNIYDYIISNIHSLCSVTAMFKREVFDCLNGYDENLYYEDLDFWIRASRLYPFDFTNEILAKKRVLQNSLGDSFFKRNLHYKKVNSTTLLVLKKALLLNNNNYENKSLLKRVFHMTKRSARAKDFDLFVKYLLLILQIYHQIIFKSFLNHLSRLSNTSIPK